MNKIEHGVDSRYAREMAKGNETIYALETFPLVPQAMRLFFVEIPPIPDLSVDDYLSLCASSQVVPYSSFSIDYSPESEHSTRRNIDLTIPKFDNQEETGVVREAQNNALINGYKFDNRTIFINSPDYIADFLSRHKPIIVNNQKLVSIGLSVNGSSKAIFSLNRQGVGYYAFEVQEFSTEDAINLKNWFEHLSGKEMPPKVMDLLQNGSISLVAPYKTQDSK